MAKDKGDHAIGIILSGTGSDGTQGITAIKEQGGMVIVQDPATAKFDGMPNSAIESGNYDYILPPKQMSDEIMRYPQVVQREEVFGNKTPPYESDAFHSVLKLVKDNSNFDFTFYKRQTLERRIAKRMAQIGISEMREYVLYLQNSAEEIQSLADEFLIGVTSFFRDPPAFEIIKQEVLPKMIDTKKEGDLLKIWVAACSTGEEAYSLAILIHEYLKKRNKLFNVKIFATDIDARAIHTAAKGNYPASIKDQVPDHILNHYFQQEGMTYTVSAEIRKMVIFAQHNLIKDLPFGQMDMVSCRNMLIYMRAELQKKVLNTFHFSLNVGGFLFLGSSESSGGIADSVREINKKWNVYQVTEQSKTFTGDHKTTDNGQSYTTNGPSVLPNRRTVESQMKEAFYEVISEELGYAAVFVNEQYDLLQAVGDYKKFIQLPENQLRISLPKLVPPALSVPLTLALRKASNQHEKVITKQIKIGEADQRRSINLVVKPHLSSPDSKQKFILVLFREEKVEPHRPDDPNNYDQQMNLERFTELENELKETKEDLQMTVEELETSNEELQSSNEELLSSNEELQSTNEELQSLNEELHTVNAEHQIKIKELQELNDDLNNYFSSSDIGQIFVDADLLIRKYTPAVTNQVNLIKSDIGRPINHLSYNLKYDYFVDDIRQVIATQEKVEKELEVGSGAFFQMRIHPYIRQDKSVDGAVITFVDISKVKQLNNLLGGVLRSSPNVIMALQSVYEEDQLVDFQCVMANEATRKILYKDPGQLEGSLLLQQMPGMKREGIFKKLRSVATRGGVLRQEIHYQHEGLNTWLEILAAPMDKGVALTISDISDKKEAEKELVQAYEDVKKAEGKLKTLNSKLEERVEERTQALSESEERFRIVAQATNDAVWDWHLISNEFWWNDTFEEIFGFDREQLAPGINALFDYLHPDDLDQVKTELDRVINAGEKQWSVEHRFRKADGSYAYVFNRAYVLQNEYGVPYRVLGAMLDISRLKEVQEELQRSNENLKRINIDLDNFVYTASHDLRTPIANLEGLMYMLKAKTAGQFEELSIIVEKIDNSINKFKGTLDALTDITKVQKNMDGVHENLSIKEVLESVKEDIKPSLQESKAEIQESLATDRIHYPKIHLRSIIYNFLSNAVKYRHPDRSPVIGLRTYEKENYVVLEVTDNGLGMTEQQQKKLFSMFRRFHDHVDGTGVGLYMVKRMVENKKGTIEVESQEGQGSTFRVLLNQGSAI